MTQISYTGDKVKKSYLKHIKKVTAHPFNVLGNATSEAYLGINFLQRASYFNFAIIFIINLGFRY